MVKAAYVGAEDEEIKRDYTIIPILRIRYNVIDIKKMEGNFAFTSKRGIISLKLNGISLKPIELYCIGKATKNNLFKYYGFTCKVPEIEDSLHLAELIINDGVKNITLVTSNQYSREMIKKLDENGIHVNIVEAYEISKNENINPQEFCNYDSLLFGSSKSFLFTLELMGLDKLKNKKIYAIGGPTARTMEAYGLKPLMTFASPDIRKAMEFIFNS